MPKDDNKGQDKVYEVHNPVTGETRTCTQKEWREQKLGQQGFQKPPDLAEADSAEGEYPGEPDVVSTGEVSEPTEPVTGEGETSGGGTSGGAA